jgi:hypothetical protein
MHGTERVPIQGPKEFGRSAGLAVSSGMTPTRPTSAATPEHPPRRTRRLKITLPEAVALRLDKLARSAGEPPAKIAADMVRQAIAEAEASGPTQEPRAQASSERDGAPNAARENRRPPWLEPYGGSREWRGLMWAAIVGLATRYPDALSSLKDGWWQDAIHLETLSALAVWRQSIDDKGGDPREEIAFHIQLNRYGASLREIGVPLGPRWKPGAPPADW